VLVYLLAEVKMAVEIVMQEIEELVVPHGHF